MRVLALLALGLLLLPLAEAQTALNPIEGRYQDVYVIAGRALDANANPVAGGRLTITLHQAGVTAQPLEAVANCKGDFITYFTLKRVDPAGMVKVVVKGEGESTGEITAQLDPFFRRSDVVVRLPTAWNNRCDEKQDVFPVSVSMTARLLTRVDPYKLDERDYHARPYEGRIRLRYITEAGQPVCPPLPNGPPDACETFVPDERGDVRYSFTLDRPFPATGEVQVILEDNRTFTAAVDPVSRLATFHLETTGQGAPAIKEAPLPPLGLVAVALVGAAIASRRLLPRAPR